MKNTSKLYRLFGARRPKKILILFSNLVEKKSLNFNFVKNWKVTILLGKDGFKLHNMAADKKNSGRISRIVWVARFFLCGRIFFCPPPYYAVWLNLILFGSIVRTMPNPRYGNLRTLHCCQAQTDKDGASNHKIDFLTYY